MTSKTFIQGTVIDSAWLNDVNSAAYGTTAIARGIQRVGSSTTTTLDAKTLARLDVGPEFGIIYGTGLNNTQQLANGLAINAAITVAKLLGMSVSLPGGPVEYDGTLLPLNGVNVYGHGSGGEASGRFSATNLRYFGNTYAVDFLGGAAGTARLQCTWSDIVFDGTGAGAAAQGTRIGWCQRSDPLFRNVTFYKFGHWGMSFVDQLWDMSFDCLRIDSCGQRTANSGGIYKDPAVDGGTWNFIRFNNLQVSGCGSASSTAGGINIQTATANRGLWFNSPIVEGNFGAAEIYISNMADLQITNLGMERLDVAGQVTGVELSGCVGGFHGGYITGSNLATNLSGVKLTNSKISFQATSFNRWGTASINAFGSTVHTGLLYGATYAGDATTQWLGLVAPRFAANKNAVDQTGVASGVFTPVTFGTKAYDTTGAYSTGTSLFTPQTLGLHQMDGVVKFNAMVDGSQVIVSIYKNGVAHKSFSANAKGAGTQSFGVSAKVLVTATADYFELQVRQSTGAPQTISGATDETYFSGEFIG